MSYGVAVRGLGASQRWARKRLTNHRLGLTQSSRGRRGMGKHGTSTAPSHAWLWSLFSLISRLMMVMTVSTDVSQHVILELMM